MKKISVFNATVLKIIAVVAMTFDHIATAIMMFSKNPESIMTFYNVAKIIGRLALPIFVFLIIEGYKHTKRLWFYFLRLGVMLTLIFFVMQVAALYATNYHLQFFKIGNIFVDLILALLIITLYYGKKLRYRLLILVPIAYFVITLLLQIAIIPQNNVIIRIMIGLSPQYPLATCFFVLIYLLLNSLYTYIEDKKLEGLEFDEEVKNEIILRRQKITYAVVLLLFTILMYILTFFSVPADLNAVLFTYFILAAIPILLYNGKLGCKSIILKYAYYLYYPVHLAIIFLEAFLLA